MKLQKKQMRRIGLAAVGYNPQSDRLSLSQITRGPPVAGFELGQNAADFQKQPVRENTYRFAFSRQFAQVHRQVGDRANAVLLRYVQMTGLRRKWCHLDLETSIDAEHGYGSDSHNEYCCA
jgi:hypothetical protein